MVPPRYFDDGTPLGSAGRVECSIDGIVQSWAVLSGAARPERATQAMESLHGRLVDHDNQLIRLFTRPFDSSEPDPGYIRAYPPGVRENGGQYTHGAVWSILAWAALGRDDRAGEAFQLINPSTRPDAAATEQYQVECTCWPPTSTGRPVRRAAAGPGTPGRQAGCTGPGWRRS